MKLKDLVNANGIVNKLISEKWKAKIRYKLDKYADYANVELERFNKIRANLFKKYGDEQPVVDENGAKMLNEQGEPQVQYVIRSEEIETFNTELSELVEEECEFIFVPLTLDDLGDIEFEPFEIKLLIDCGLVKDPEDE